jgi:arsenate reductase-like glutaredoxin family protein
MTANEMADRNEWACCAYSKEVSAMLRQQQAEIEALKLRELTDEEIVNLYKETEADNGGIREFARAILKKASEK